MDHTVSLFCCSLIGLREVCPSYQIIGDNVDLHQRPTHRSMDRKDRDHHWFHLYAVGDRVTGQDLSNDAPIAGIAKLPLQTFLPSLEECRQLRQEFGILISRVIVEKMAYFAPLKPIVPVHIQHAHAAEMKKKSELVSVFGVF